MSRKFRHTKIVFTIGPATESEAALLELINAGVDVCRLNMAHATHEWTRETIRKVRRVCAEAGREIAIMMDVKGPEIRTGKLESPLKLQRGSVVDFVATEDAESIDNIPAVFVNYPHLAEDVKEGATLLVDNGLLQFEIKQLMEGRVRAVSRSVGELTSRRHINLPGTHVRLPSLTRKDRLEVKIGAEEGVDFFALSFVRTADDIDIFRRYLNECDSGARVIAKIEDQQAITNLDEIIQAADGLMVARGDLGVECPYEELPIIQHRAIKSCISNFKPVIVATHMLESMIEAPVPTRAEVTDVANAVAEQADSLMLSGETAVGKFPFACVDVMKRIAYRMEEERKHNNLLDLTLRTPKAKMLRSAALLASENEGSAIIVFTRNGYLPQILSSLRPAQIPIFAFTDNQVIFRQLLLLWGVEPFLIEFESEREDTIVKAIQTLLRTGWVDQGNWAIVITNALARNRMIDSVQLRRIEQ
jgi:pyruvate kinase